MTRLLILTTGSHGDHAPYIGLGDALTRHSHHVTLAGTARFAALADDSDITYATLPEVPVTSGRTERANAGGLRGLRTLIHLGVEQARVQLPALRAAAADADVLAATPATLLYARPLAQAHGLRLIVLPLQPAVATRQFTPPVAGGADLGALLNRALTELGGRFATRLFTPVVREVRRELGLSPEDPRAADAQIAALPTIHGFSSAVQPRPADWPTNAQVAGYWPTPTPRGWQPDPDLVDFLADGAPPVFVGFGSMVGPHTPRLVAALSDALGRTGHRAIVQRGEAALELDAALQNTSDVLTVDHVPHDWLFPQVAAVVHHAGAGTTAATLRAGVPSLPIPHAHDQPFWARRLVALGAAPTALPAHHLHGAHLAAALAQTVGAPTYRRRASHLAEHLTTEDALTPILNQLTGRLRNQKTPRH